ncbi:MAG: pilus assembly protein N-terminal domain-containing protein [Candidatus Omnitrophota bacterium]|nr:MAG: pilus assembly protein N-terminal domain-containing protein [Candidatus Omnitrophota bacterium]
MSVKRYRTLIFIDYKRGVKILLALAIFLSSAASLYSQSLSYEYLIELGEKYYEKANYSEALHYFQLAQLVKPSSQQAMYYINLIKREIEGRVIPDARVRSLEKDILIRKRTEKLRQKDILIKEKAEAIKRLESEAREREQKLKRAAREREEELRIAERQREEKIRDVLDSLERGISRLEKLERERKLTEREKVEKDKKLAQLKKLKEKEKAEKKKRLAELKELKEKIEKDKKLTRLEKLKKEELLLRKEKEKEKKKIVAVKYVEPEIPRKPVEKGEVFYLTPEKKKEFPLTVEMRVGESFIIKSEGAIKRFLVVSPERVTAERADASSIVIKSKGLGSTFLHVWDEEGRWTFNVKITPYRRYIEQKRTWQDFPGFKFKYGSNWRQYYRGDSFKLMERRSLGFNQSAKISGPTPYGDLNAFMKWSRLKKKQEVTGYSVGLSDGHLFGFDDFSIQGFDVRESFSPLTLPGKSLYGVTFNSPAFDNKLSYTLVYGKERPSYYGFISPGVSSEEDSYIEGVRIGLFPDEQNKFFFNYARGYGGGRQDYLEDKVFSLQSRHRFDNLSLSSEIASDQDRIAANFSSDLRLDKLNLRFSFYDVEKDFVTITGRPPNRGKIGSRFGAGWRPTDKLSLSSNLNMYKDRLNFNPDKRGELNYEWDSSLNYYLDQTSDISGSIYYTYTPGLYSPQRNLRASSTYNKRFNLGFFGDRRLSSYLGYSYQKNRSPLSPSSDYDRNGLLSGLRLALTEDISYFLRYNYSYVKEIQSGDVGHPSVMITGLDFRRKFSPSLSSNLRFSYRDEEKTDSRHSFLSGQDSLEGSIGLTYRPSPDAEFFLNGGVRNVWAENPDSSKYIEANFRLGTRLSWDNFFRWAPKTVIEGAVFKDANANGIQDEGEEGIADVKVTVGPNQVSADKEGKFKTVVKVKSLVANVDFSTIPEGYILTTPLSIKVDTSHGGVKKINFGLSKRSGIYGVVFYDVNDDGKLDTKDIPIAGAKITLDGKKATFTNSRGVYFFANIVMGKHTVQIDVNSLPLEYLPKISIKKDIEITEEATYSHHIPLRRRDK